MRKRNWAVLVAAVSALLALAVPAAMSAAGVKTTVTLGAAGYQGKVSAASPACVANRTVVLKQKGNGVISRATSKENGNWKADLDELNEKIKIPAMVYAEVKASSPAGPVATCLAATSKTVEIAGG
jgi:hypothetical protein